MSYTELSRYITDLKQSGFDTKRLSVQLNTKIAYPLITLVMAILAIPFALSMGKQGSLAGIATAIGLAIAYWVVALIFRLWATSIPCLQSWPPGRPISSSASPAPIFSSAPPPKLEGPHRSSSSGPTHPPRPFHQPSIAATSLPNKLSQPIA